MKKVLSVALVGAFMIMSVNAQTQDVGQTNVSQTSDYELQEPFKTKVRQNWSGSYLYVSGVFDYMTRPIKDGGSISLAKLKLFGAKVNGDWVFQYADNFAIGVGGGLQVSKLLGAAYAVVDLSAFVGAPIGKVMPFIGIGFNVSSFAVSTLPRSASMAVMQASLGVAVKLSPVWSVKASYSPQIPVQRQLWGKYFDNKFELAFGYKF